MKLVKYYGWERYFEQEVGWMDMGVYCLVTRGRGLFCWGASRGCCCVCLGAVQHHPPTRH